jgi:hypothetical protein
MARYFAWLMHSSTAARQSLCQACYRLATAAGLQPAQPYAHANFLKHAEPCSPTLYAALCNACSVCDSGLAKAAQCNPDNFNMPSIALTDLQPGLKRTFTRVVQVSVGLAALQMI